MVLAAHQRGEVLDDMPAVPPGELKAVAPHVHQGKAHVRGGQEFLAQIQQPGVAVVAGGVPAEEVRGQVELPGGHGGAGVQNPLGLGHGHHLVGVAAIGVGHAHHQAAGEGLQGLAVLGDFPGDLGQGRGHGVQVAHGVDGHLVALVQLLHLPGGDEIPVGGVQPQSAGVQVEGAL